MFDDFFHAGAEFLSSIHACIDIDASSVADALAII